MGDANPHECAGDATLIFACSGAADVGALSDRAARKLTWDGKGKMFCLAGLGGRVPAIIEKTRAAARILALDGCSLDCTKKTLEEAGFAQFEHVRVTDLGLEKGRSAVTDQNVALVAEAAGSLIG
jgi:uncharacterized metal-binding protein